MESDNKTWLLPHDDEMEGVMIGSLMQLRDAISETRNILTTDCFYNSVYRRIYTAIMAIDARGQEPDLLTVYQQLKDKGSDITPGFLAELSGKRAFVYKQHALSLRELAAMRKAFHIGYKLMSCSSSGERGGYDLIDEVSKELQAIYRHEQDHVTTIGEALRVIHERIGSNLTQEGMTGSPTGFSEFDKRGGLQPGWLVIIGADTSAGKTSLATFMALNSAQSGAGVSFYSMEMEAPEVVARMASIMGNVGTSKLLYGKLCEKEISDFDKAAGRLVGIPLYFDDRSTTGIDKILSSLRYMKLKYGIAGAVVDYAQILSVISKSANSREQQLAEASRSLKNAAKELGIWVLLLSQLNRDKTDSQPTMSRLRDSAQMADAADVVMLLYRPEMYGKKYPEPFSQVSTKSTAFIDVAKGRSIGTFQFIVGFEREYTRFYDLKEVPKAEVDEEEEAPF